MFDKKIYSGRRDRLRKKLGRGTVLLPGNPEAPMNYPANAYRFRQDSTFSYFFGLHRPNLAGIIDADGGRDVIFGDDPGLDDVIWTGPQPSLSEQAARSGVDKVLPSAALADRVRRAAARREGVLFLPQYRAENRALVARLCGARARPSLELILAVVSLREIKEACEIAELEKAAETGRRMHLAAMRLCRPGLYERDIAGAVEGIALAGGGALSFPVICSQHGETLHNHCHSGRLQAGKLLLVDAGCETETLYASDNTRTLPVGGKFTRRQRDVYDIVLRALEEASAMARPGLAYQQAHRAAARVLTRGLKDLGLMKGDTEEAVENGAYAMFMPHGLGHMMGLDVHDMEALGQVHVGYDEEVRPAREPGAASLRLGKKLKPGFVLTVEPGCYFIPALIEKWRRTGLNRDFINFGKALAYSDFGGIRIEDDLLITPTGSRRPGKPIPRTAAEVERAMAG